MKETRKKPITVFGVELVYLILFGIIVAFIGWIGENAFKFAVSGNFDSRFHILPFISPYILIPFAFHVALGSPDDLRLFGKKIFKERTVKTVILSNVISYLLICTFVFLGELAVGNAWDKLFGVQLWDYSKHAYHFTQYTSPMSTFGFGTAAYLIFRLIYFPVLSLLRRKVSFKTAKIICLTLGTFIVLDTVRMMLFIVFTGEAPMLWTYYNGKFEFLP